MRKQKTRSRQLRYGRLSPTSTLPEGYRLKSSFSLAQGNYRRLILLNLLGAVLFVAFGLVFLTSALNLRPELGDAIILFGGQGTMIVLLGNLAGMAVLLVLHELTHGLFFWWHTRARPVLGVRLFYAYAAAPGWYLPRGQYFLTALAPLVLLTALGYAALLLIPPMAALPVLFGMTMNAAGSVGDLAVVVWLIGRPWSALVEDVGEAVNLY